MSCANSTQGRPAGELWNWYPPVIDTMKGMGSGDSARVASV